MIIDNAIARGHGHTYHKHLSRAQWERMVNARRRAESFVFSTAACALMGRFANECGDLILRHRQFAVPPFSDTYIELDINAFIQQFPKNHFPTGRPEKGLDHRIGYLISGERLYVVVEGGEGSPATTGAEFMPLYFTMAPPGEHARWDRPEFGRPITIRLDSTPEEHSTQEWNLLVTGLGSTVRRIHDEEERQSLLHEFMPHWQGDTRGIHQKALDMILQGASGEIRNVWTALLWLNRPVHTSIVNVPASRRISRGRLVTYKAHRTVEIDLHKHRSIRRAFVHSGERVSPRRHRVRGAFHHSGGAFACSHDWPLRPDVDGHWKCQRCGRLRWWVKDHVRGDATKGWVEHDYAVTTGEAEARP